VLCWQDRQHAVGDIDVAGGAGSAETAILRRAPGRSYALAAPAAKAAAHDERESVMRRFAWRLTPCLGLAALLAVALRGGGAADDAERLARAGATPPAHAALGAQLHVAARSADPPGLLVSGAEIRGRAHATLSAEASSPLVGWLAPSAVPDAGGRRVIYGAWRELRADDPGRSWGEQGIEPGDALARPSLRLHDLTTGADTLLAAGAYSAAWRRDGAVAFVRGVDREYRAWRRYVGDLVVRDGPRGRDVRWSDTADRYVAAAWAGDTLLAYRIRTGEQLDLLALDGPGRIRLLGAGTSLVAVSPDGRRIAVADATAMPGVLRILDVAEGNELARLALGLPESEVPTWVGYAGSWVDDSLVAESDEGLALFRVSGNSVALVRLLGLDRDAYPSGGVEPRFAQSGERFVVRAETASVPGHPAATVLLECDPAAATCALLASAAPRAWLRFVYNPSRPLGGAG